MSKSTLELLRLPPGASAAIVFRFGKAAIPQGRAIAALDAFPLAGVSAGRDGGLCEARRTCREDASRGALRPLASPWGGFRSERDRSEKSGTVPVSFRHGATIPNDNGRSDFYHFSTT